MVFDDILSVMQNGLKYAIFETEWGFFGLLANDKGIIKTSLPARTAQVARKYLLVGMFGIINEDTKLYPELLEMIKAYYKGFYVNFTTRNFPLISLNGSGFICKVLKVCTRIRPGETISYGQLAQRAGYPKAGRAAGNVLAKNPLPLIIPCHRVVRSDGKIGSFSAPGGSRTKKQMIEHEKKLIAGRV